MVAGKFLLGLAHDQVGEERAAEFFGSLLLINAGAMLVASSNELVFLFVGLELVSIPTYLLLYLPRRTPATQEAVTKYFYLSVFSSALLLFGLAYLYGLTGVGNLKAAGYLLHSFDPAGASPAPLAFGVIAVLFVMAGLGFRVAAVPFHFYAPDVYQGAPTVIAAMLAWIPKGVGFVAMLRVLTTVVGGAGALAEKAVILTWVLAVATMVLGNTMALIQNDLKTAAGVFVDRACGVFADRDLRGVCRSGGRGGALSGCAGGAVLSGHVFADDAGGVRCDSGSQQSEASC